MRSLKTQCLCRCLLKSSNHPLAFSVAYGGTGFGQPGDHSLAAQVLVKVIWAGINGGCETFRVRGEPYTACGPTPIRARVPCMFLNPMHMHCPKKSSLQL